MKKPLVWLAILFSSGIICSQELKIPMSWLYLTAGTIFISSVLLRKNSAGMIFLAALVFVCGMIRWNAYCLKPPDHICKFSYEKGRIYSLKGWVSSQPEFQDGKTTFRFRMEEISTVDKKRSCSGDIQVVCPGMPHTAYGEQLILAGGLQKPYGYYWQRKGISRIARVKTPDFIRKTGKIKVSVTKKMLFGLQARIKSGFERNLTPLCAAVIEAMTLGEQTNIPVKIYKDMIRTGTVHILVVSGSNVGVVGFICVLALKILRVPRLPRFFCCALLLLLYCLLTGASNPVVRATIMCLVFLFAYFVRREPDIYNSCACAGLIILFRDPAQLRDIGFQLSFASVLAIAFFYPRLKSLFGPEKLKLRILRFSAESCLVSLSAWLGTAWLIAGYFRMVSPITVLANIFIVPLASLITLSGFSLLIVQSVSHYLALSFVPVNELLVSLLLRLNSLLLAVPWAYFYF